MAQRDLDAALQLLADRGQYITGASGAAIALRREGRGDMLCRASVGSNAPELGALLSTEFGLSGESVRTRRLLRCDDAERDVRVNREVCRQMGIASVLVMPVVNDDQVLGVFELFSGKANAFGDRDLSAVQRLSQMVETAVRLAYAADDLPGQLNERESSLAEGVPAEVFEGQSLGDLVLEDVDEVQPPPEPQSVEKTAAALESPVTRAIPHSREVSPKANSPELKEGSALPAVPAVSVPANVARPVHKPLFRSAAAAGEGDAVSGGTDQSHLPPVLRGLHICEACGFPISEGRILCVECEDKKWRELLWTKEPARKPPAGVAAVSDAKTTGRAFTGAVASMAKTRAAAQGPGEVVWEPGPAATRFDAENSGSTPDELTGRVFAASSERPEVIFSAGIEPARSWFSANRYVLLALLGIGIALTVFLLIR